MRSSLLSALVLKTWEDCRLCWEAKGYKLDSITLELMKVGKYGRSTIGKLMNTTRDAPPEVIEKVWSLELVPGASERKYEIYLRGLEATASPGSTPTPPEPVKVQPVDVDAVAAGVADKVVARVPSAGDIADEVSARVLAKAEEASGKLDQAGQTLQLVHAQQGGMDARVRSLGQALWVLTGVVALGFSALVLVAWQSVAPKLTLLLGGVVPGIHAEMGGPKTGEPVPNHPWPGQSRPPCAMGATELFGGCWVKVADQKPPCLPDFYSHGDACYLPAFKSRSSPNAK